MFNDIGQGECVERNSEFFSVAFRINSCRSSRPSGVAEAHHGASPQNRTLRQRRPAGLGGDVPKLGPDLEDAHVLPEDEDRRRPTGTVPPVHGEAARVPPKLRARARRPDQRVGEHDRISMRARRSLPAEEIAVPAPDGHV